MLLISIFLLRQSIHDDVSYFLLYKIFSQQFSLSQMVSCSSFSSFALTDGIFRTSVVLRMPLAAIKDVPGSQAKLLDWRPSSLTWFPVWVPRLADIFSVVFSTHFMWVFSHYSQAASLTATVASPEPQQEPLELIIIGICNILLAE